MVIIEAKISGGHLDVKWRARYCKKNSKAVYYNYPHASRDKVPSMHVHLLGL
jgi:hypothetical protein